MSHWLSLSVKTAVQSMDRDASEFGEIESLDLDEMWTRGKVHVQIRHPNATQTGFTTSTFTRFLPMKVVQGVQIYDQLARTAAATKTSPPTIQL